MQIQYSYKLSKIKIQNIQQKYYKKMVRNPYYPHISYLIIVVVILYLITMPVSTQPLPPQKCPEGCAKCYEFQNIYKQINCTECLNDNQWQYKVGAYSHIGKCTRRTITRNQAIILIISLVLFVIALIVCTVVWALRNNQNNDRKYLTKVEQIDQQQYKNKSLQKNQKLRYQRKLRLKHDKKNTIYYLLTVQDNYLFTNQKNDQKKQNNVPIELSNNQGSKDQIKIKLMENQIQKQKTDQYQIDVYIQQKLDYTWSGYVSYKQNGYLKTKHVTETRTKNRIVKSNQSFCLTLSQFVQMYRKKTNYFKNPPQQYQQKCYGYFGSLSFQSNFWTASKGTLHHYCILNIKISNKNWREPIITSFNADIDFNQEKFVFVPIQKNQVRYKDLKLQITQQITKKKDINYNSTQMQKLIHRWSKQQTANLYIQPTLLLDSSRKQYKVQTEINKKFTCYFSIFSSNFDFLQKQHKTYFISQKRANEKIQAAKYVKQDCCVIGSENFPQNKKWLSSGQLKFIVKIRQTGFKNWLLSLFVTKKYQIPLRIQKNNRYQQDEIQEKQTEFIRFKQQ